MKNSSGYSYAKHATLAKKLGSLGRRTFSKSIFTTSSLLLRARVLVTTAGVMRHHEKNDGSYQRSAERYSDFNFLDNSRSNRDFGGWQERGTNGEGIINSM